VKVLLDQNVFFEIAQCLRDAGVDARHARELGLSRAPDTEILRFAAQNDWVIVTHDDDYHMLLAVGVETRPSVVRLRVVLPLDEMAATILRTLRTFHEALLVGAAVSVTARGARMHRLPFV
jgi:predicted nuclease of predicted toxin-antitoxin system